MGKIDDMRRQREEQFAEAEKARAKRSANGVSHAKAAVPAPVDHDIEVPATVVVEEPAHAPQKSKAPQSSLAKSGAAKTGASKTDDEKGKCSVCGKMKPLQNGLLAQHQKGFGKACPGSRKEPV